jgi:hypothetical protein
MAKTGFDDRELRQLIKDTSIAQRGSVIFARKMLKSASFALEKRIKTEMPVDTGRARASWGHGRDAVWIESNGGLSIEQGSNLAVGKTRYNYIIALNRGHSQQAPAGFIDRALVVAEFELAKELGAFDPLNPAASLGVQLPLMGLLF